MDERASHTIEAGRQFDWPPAETVRIANDNRHAPTDLAENRQHHGPEPTGVDATDSSRAAAAVRPPPAVQRDDRNSGTARWRSAGARAAGICTIGLIALLGQGSVSQRERQAASGTHAVAAHDQPLASSITAPVAEPVRTSGTLRVPGPAGARIWLDGAPRGKAPLSITDVAPGAHEVRVATNAGEASDRVLVEAGSVASFVLSTPALRSSAPIIASRGKSQPLPVSAAPGTVNVVLPFDVQIYEDGRFAGINRAVVMLPPGSHRLELVNESLGYRAVETVQVESDKAVKIPSAPPMGTVSLNAMPWAEVFIDGRKIGETPLAQVSIAVGAHEIVFRHPQLGEQSRSLTVTAAGPARLSVDLRK
jgi:hypothetical protein